MKRVIFIGGTAYSGSTMLDMILSNSRLGFSCGEIDALFRPYRKHHFSPECGCGNTSCDIWPRLKIGGEQYVYENIFRMFPDVEYIIDSSKDPLWITDQSSRLKLQGIDTKNVLIWKTPGEFFNSMKKRGKHKLAAREWIKYHRFYFSLIDKFAAIKYQEFTKDQKVLLGLTSYLGIGFNPDMYQYWEKKHHTLFGNTSAKIHLYAGSSQVYDKCRSELADISHSDAPTDSDPMRHREIYYNCDSEKIPLNGIEQEYIDRIEKILILRTPGNRNAYTPSVPPELEDLRLPDSYTHYRNIKNSIRTTIASLMYG